MQIGRMWESGKRTSEGKRRELDYYKKFRVLNSVIYNQRRKSVKDTREILIVSRIKFSFVIYKLNTINYKMKF